MRAGISIIWKKMKIGMSVRTRALGYDTTYAPRTPAIAPLAPMLGSGVWIQDRMDDAGAESAEQIEYEIREVAEPVFNVVAEDPEIPHVPDKWSQPP